MRGCKTSRRLSTISLKSCLHSSVFLCSNVTIDNKAWTWQGIWVVLFVTKNYPLRAYFWIRWKVKLGYYMVEDWNEKPGSHRVKLIGSKLHWNEPVLWVVLLHDLVALKNTTVWQLYFVITCDVIVLSCTCDLLVVLLLFFFWLYCKTTVTPFIRRGQGWSLWSGRVLDQSQQKCRFFAEIQVCCKLFQLQPKWETYFSSLRDRLEKSFIISPANWTICAGVRGTSGFRPVSVTAVALTN